MRYLRSIMTVTLCSIMVYDGVKFIYARSGLLFAWNLDLLFYLHDIVYLFKVHVLFTEHKAFQVNH